MAIKDDMEDIQEAVINELITENGITNTLADGQVIEAKIANNAVTAAKIADGSVTAAKIADGSVTPPKLSAGAPYWDSDGTFRPQGNASIILDNGLPDGAQLFLASTGHATFYLDNDSGNFRVVQATTERMRIDSSGNVGINDTNPAYPLEVNGTIRAVGTNNLPALIVDGNSTDEGDIVAANGEHITFGHHGLTGATGQFTERMRIDNNGILMLGSTNYGNGLYDGNSFKYSITSGIRISRDTTAAANQVTFHNPNGQVGFINSENNATLYSTSSDYRLKTDVVDMKGSLERLKALKPCNFRWISDGTRVDGFLAHEAQEVVPEAVTGTKDAMTTEEYEVVPAVLDDEGNEVTPAEMGTREVPDYQGIDQAKLVPLLTKALQEAVVKIEALEARVEALENI